VPNESGDMKHIERYPREIAYHEAGHAVVGWAFGVEVSGCRVFYDDAKGWKGETDASLAQVGQLPLLKRIAFFAAGYTAERVFQCPILHDRAADADNKEIYLALMDKGIAEDDHPARIAESERIARRHLKAHSVGVMTLAGRLTECGHVNNASEFLRLMR
jgi:hypothetical protein